MKAKKEPKTPETSEKEAVQETTGPSYEEWFDLAVSAFKKVPKSTVAFDYAKIPKEIRIKLLQDPEYVNCTRQVLAAQYVRDIEKLNEVLDGSYGIENKDPSGTILKAISMKQEILYKNLGVEADESNALNVVFISLTEKEFSELDQVEVYQGEGNMDAASALDSIPGEDEE